MNRITDISLYEDMVLNGDLDVTGQIQGNGGLDVTGQIQGNLINNQMVHKATFDILGLMSDPRFINLQCDDPGAGTMYDVSGQGNNGTYYGSMTTADRFKKGMGWGLEPGGSDYIGFSDNDAFSFGDGTDDEAFTLFALVDFSAGGAQTLMGKYDGGLYTLNKEWIYNIDSGGKPHIRFWDHSADVHCIRLADDALSEGIHLVGVTYDGAGGATAADTIKFYVDGSLVASTATNAGGYVSMENTACLFNIGAFVGSSAMAEVIRDSFSCVGMDGSEWSAHSMHSLYQLVKGLYAL